MIKGIVEEQFVGTAVLDRADEPIGEVRQVFVDESAQPVWASVRVALLGSEVLVPLDDADWNERSLHLAVTSTKALGAYAAPCVRGPRTDAELPPIDDGGVCYSVRDDTGDVQEPQPNGAAMKEAEESTPPTVSGHMLPSADEVTDQR